MVSQVQANANIEEKIHKDKYIITITWRYSYGL